MGKLVLAAPLSGWVVPLKEVPDAAFADGMVGEGAAIDPLDALLIAPCDGEVALLAGTHHAVTIRADNGAEILMHVGIDTVALKGAGLRAHVTQGQRVCRGDPLLGLDLDSLVYMAKSLVTPVIVTNGAGYSVVPGPQNRFLAAGDDFMEIEVRKPGERANAAVAAPASPGALQRLTVQLEHGIHARPAARIARASRRFDALTVLSVRGKDADTRSTVALMALGIRNGDIVEVRGYGADALDAVAAVAAEIAPASPVPRTGLPGPARAERTTQGQSEPPTRIRGIVASRGIAVGVAQHLVRPQIRVPESGGDAAQESADLRRAISEAKSRLQKLLAVSNSDILDAHLEFLDDPTLLRAAEAAIRQGRSAGRAWQAAIAAARESFAALDDTRLAERAADLRDVEAQVLEALTQADGNAQFDILDGAIVLATELLPTQFARLDLANVAGICSAEGGATSHVGLLAASMGIPALVGTGTDILGIAHGTQLILDADEGVLHVDPDSARVATVSARLVERRTKMRAWLRDASADCRTADGCRIHVFANLASVSEALDAVKQGAEGCGLLRTEFMFLGRRAAPTEREQWTEYQKIADALGERPLVIRTLDAGGDKPIAYLPLPREENPLLGLRGLRTGLLFPQLLADQLAAILQVAPASQCRILLPMVTDAGEVRDIRKILDTIVEQRRLNARPLLGAMIETPASVVSADWIAREADFLSIGTNDLAQYTLAMDRSHPELARRFDFFHPAIFRQIASVCSAADAEGCPVSVCGALASEPKAAAILIGLGVRTVSAVPAIIPELKATIRQYGLQDCERLAQSVLAADSPASVRQFADNFAARRGAALAS